MADKEKNDQKIKCNVSECVHNCIEDCSCRLEKIQVCPCTSKIDEGAPQRDKTACASFYNAGDLNVTEITGRD
ncbi:unknown [Clostridium sp. CAG:1219]|nr:unknown [Clostridium sp. CAG:1219]